MKTIIPSRPPVGTNNNNNNVQEQLLPMRLRATKLVRHGESANEENRRERNTDEEPMKISSYEDEQKDVKLIKPIVPATDASEQKTLKVAKPLVSAAEQEYEQPLYSRRETLLTMAGVLMVMLLASLDQTIVATAMPRIIGELQGFNQYAWVSTSYLLASTVMVPIYGKISDLVGRKPIFLFGVIVFLIGSAMSGAAQSMTQLILFRGFQGLGAGALMPIALAIVGDLFTPRERGKWQGVTGAVFGLSAIVGPVAGGWITEYSTWRWIFYVNLPIGIVALLVLIFLMPNLHAKEKGKRISIDYLGAALLAAGTIPLLLGFSWAGTQYAWASAQVIGLFSASLVVLTTFFFYEMWLEHRGGQPVLSPSLFKNSIFSVCALITGIFGIALFGSVFFIPLYVQGVVGTSATNSGLILTPLMLTAMVGSIISGQLVSKFGKYKWISIVGMFIAFVGSFLLVRLDIHSTNLDVIIAMLVLGLGMGTSMSLYTLIVQNAMPRKIGEATSVLTFFRSIGGTIGLAAMGSVLTSAYLPGFHSALPVMVKRILPAKVLGFFDNPQILLSPQAQVKIHAQFASFGPRGEQVYHVLIDAVKQGLTQGIHNVFVLSLIVVGIALFSSFFLKEIRLRDKRSAEKSVAASGNDAAPEAAVPAMFH